LVTFKVDRNITTYNDNSLGPGASYYYRVYAHSLGGDSAPTETVTVAMPAIPPPAAPSGLAVTQTAGTTEAASLPALAQVTYNYTFSITIKLLEATPTPTPAPKPTATTAPRPAPTQTLVPTPPPKPPVTVPK